MQNALLRQTILQMALGHVPFVRTRLAAAGIDARAFKGLEELPKLAPTLRRDVLDPVRNTEGPGAVILHGTEEGVKRFSDRAVLWRVALARMMGGEEVQRLAIEAASRAIHIHLVSGVGGVVPVAYTRDDLDLLARAGARVARVAGLERDERLLYLVPPGPTLDFWGIFYMAHGMGMSAVHARPRAGELEPALRAAFGHGRPTVVAVPSDEAVLFCEAAPEAGMDLSELRVLFAVGRSLTPDERATASQALAKAGARDARVCVAYGPAEGRVLWTECIVPPGHAQTFGFHTYPDLEVVEVVSPEGGEPAGAQAPGEIVVTPLGFRGGGAPRWRTGDLAAGGITHQPCPNCGRTVPRVGPSVQRNAWIRRVNLNGGAVEVDLRGAAAAVSEFARDWQLEVVNREERSDLFVYLQPRSDDVSSVIALYEELDRWQSPPTQIVVATEQEMEKRRRAAGGPWSRFLERSAR